MVVVLRTEFHAAAVVVLFPLKQLNKGDRVVTIVNAGNGVC